MKYDGYKNEFPFGSDILSNENPQVIFNGLGRGFPLLEIDDYIWNPNNR